MRVTSKYAVVFIDIIPWVSNPSWFPLIREENRHSLAHAPAS